MNVPWIEIRQHQDEDDRGSPGFSEYAWQALFACQVKILPHPDWTRLRWGFNAQALFEEALERQKLFLESQYSVRNGVRIENPEHRTLAYRFINHPGKGLSLAVLGKIHARTNQEAKESAAEFYRAVQATFPYDYTLIPAVTREDFLRMSGWDILDKNESHLHLAEIKRLEAPILPTLNSLFIQSLWQSGPRAHEPVWRSLASSDDPVMMNVALRPAVLYEEDQEALLDGANAISEFGSEYPNPKTLSAVKQWNEAYVERRLAPWKKFFYLQILFASPRPISENLYRIAGTSLTLTHDQQPSPGYQVEVPRDDSASTWQHKLKNLDFIPSGRYLSVPRLSEIADLEEVFAVMRLPYSPPDEGFADVRFITVQDI